MNAFWLVFIGIMGLCWGSFLNVLYLRSLSGQSLFDPPSSCPVCSLPLKWRHLIPILSFLILKGRCEYCGEKISLIYPCGEILGCVIFLFAFLHFPSITDSIAVIFILSMLLVMAATDIKVRKISKWLCLIVMIAGVVFNFDNLLSSFLGILVSAGVMYLFRFLGYKFLKREVAGLGDVYLSAALGAVVGISNIFLYFILVILLEGLFAFPNYILTSVKNMDIQKLKYLTFFIVSCFFLYVLKSSDLFFVKPLLVLITGISLFLFYILVQVLLNDLKNAKTNEYCPLAPAIMLSCLLFLV